MLSNSLATERRARGWSQSQTAALAGITRQSYAAIEAGVSVPSTEVAMRLARGFGRRVEELFRLGDGEVERERARWVGGEGAVGRRVRLARVGGRRLAVDVSAGGMSAGLADGVVVGIAGEGEGEVEVEPLEARPRDPDLVVVGCDPAMGIVAESLRAERGIEVIWTPMGSRGALESLARGDAHIAGAHLRDPEGADFNAASVRELVPFPCTRISFAVWEQGLVVGRGNPAGLATVEDLARPGIRFLNREPGSGSRALVDERLRRAGIPAESVVGYGTRARSHFAVAEAIAADLADTGVAIRAAALAYGLDVVPLAVERYDLVVPDHFLDLPAVQALLDQLRVPSLRRQVDALGGYDVGPMGEVR